jgi:hypothetical protein
VQELLDPILLAYGVHVGDLLLGYGGEVQVHLHDKTIILGYNKKWYRISEGRGQKRERRKNRRNMDIKCARSCKLLRGDFENRFRQPM